jgi:hypothetical protein
MPSMALMPVCRGSLTGWRCDDAGRLDLDAAAVGRLDRALAVDRLAERVDDAADQRLADGHVDDAARCA